MKKSNRIGIIFDIPYSKPNIRAYEHFLQTAVFSTFFPYNLGLCYWKKCL